MGLLREQRVIMLPLKCSLVQLIVLISFTCTAITAQQLPHLNDFTVKNDAQDLLALPSNNAGVIAASVLPPTNYVPPSPPTVSPQQLQLQQNVVQQPGQVNQIQVQQPVQQQQQSRQYVQQSYPTVFTDNKAEESYMAGPVMSYAPFPAPSPAYYSRAPIHGVSTPIVSRPVINRSFQYHNHPAPYYNPNPYHGFTHNHGHRHRYLTQPRTFVPSPSFNQPTVLKAQDPIPPGPAPAVAPASAPPSGPPPPSPQSSGPPSGPPSSPPRGSRQLFPDEPTTTTYTASASYLTSGNYTDAQPGPPFFPPDTSPYFQHYNPQLNSIEHTGPIPVPPPSVTTFAVSSEGSEIPITEPPYHTQSITEKGLYQDQKFLDSAVGSGLNLYKNFLKSPFVVINNVFTLLKKFSVPKEHYLNVISFVGVYLFMSILFFGYEDYLQPKCEEGGDAHLQKEWHYHVGRRFVPAVRTVDPKMQRKFLELFKGLHLDGDDGDDGGSSSSEETGMSVNDLCPRGAFFYSLAPMHLEARMQVQRILVAQPTPAHVYRVAKDLLYKHKIHPKIWYLGLVAAALERPDMTGFRLPHPLDAIPDWFIPAHLIQDEMDRYRARNNLIQKRTRRSAGNSTLTIVVPDSPTTSSSVPPSSSTTSPMPNVTTTIKTTRRPIFTRRPTSGARPTPDSGYSGSVESGSLEGFILDGAPQKGDLSSYDEDTINESIQKYQQINQKGSKYSRTKSPSRKTTKPFDDNKIDSSTQNDISASTENLSGPLTGTGPTGSLPTGLNNDPMKQNENDIDLPTVSFEIFGDEKKPLPVPSIRDDQEDDDDSESDETNDDVRDKKKKNSSNKKKKHSHRGKGKGKGKKKGKGKGKDSDEDDHCIVVDGKIGRDNGIENRLWYFREDMMVSQNHWYWHLAHPVNATRHPDRRAELFFFTHRQFLARYESERLSNGLNRMITMEFGPGGVMYDPYHSHLADVASGKYWTPRHAKRMLRDIHHIHNPDIIKNIELKDVNKVYKLIQKAVTFGIMLSNNGLLPISNTRGIEPLANTVEATELSVNPGIYDAFGLHNMGHLLIGLVEDPDWTYKKTPGVMAEVATSMRDPIFYNYHAVIDNIFEKHKEALPPYKTVGGEFPLMWKGIEILDIEMVSKGNGPLNQLRTFWTKKKFELAPSVDGSTNKDDDHAKICAVHLAHEPFTFKITIERKPCTQSKSGKGTIRIFIAPRYDEKGKRIRLRDQRRLMIQLDSFQAKLRVGRNVITRRSHDSSLTRPWTESLHDLENDNGHPGAAPICGCGWPQHLFVPKGSPKGMPFDLFVMVTNFDEDFVPNDPKDLEIPETCNSPHLFCGLPRRRYPDARPMGYPFDRPPYKTPIPCLPGYSFAAVVCKSFNLVFFKPIDTLEEFVSKAPNMKSIVFDIRHIDKLVSRYYHH